MQKNETIQTDTGGFKMNYGKCSVCGKFDVLGIDDRCPDCLSDNIYRDGEE